jgi:hypothetical protein
MNMTDDNDPRARIRRAIEGMEATFLELAEVKTRTAIAAVEAMPGLDGLMAKATNVTGRMGHCVWPQVSFGHLSMNGFEALLSVLHAKEDEVVRTNNDQDGRSYMVMTARRHGVWFTAQRDAGAVVAEARV